MRAYIQYLFLILFTFSCHPKKAIQSIGRENVKVNSINSSSILELKPYADSVFNATSKIIGVNIKVLTKEKPNSTLGNVFTDAMLHYAKRNNLKVDAAIANYGGIRLNSLPIGKISIGKIYELSPFENFYTVVEIKGEILQEWCNQIADKGGDPIGGISFTMMDKKAIDIKVANENIDTDKIYYVATNDYLAMGNDGCTFLKNTKQTVYTHTIRQCIIDFIISKNTLAPNNNKPIKK